MSPRNPSQVCHDDGELELIWTTEAVMTLITVTGEIMPGDDRRFAEISRSTKSELVVVNLSGPGGDQTSGTKNRPNDPR
jgi:hypothetical protein